MPVVGSQPRSTGLYRFCVPEKRLEYTAAWRISERATPKVSSCLTEPVIWVPLRSARRWPVVQRPSWRLPEIVPLPVTALTLPISVKARVRASSEVPPSTVTSQSSLSA